MALVEQQESEQPAAIHLAGPGVMRSIISAGTNTLRNQRDFMSQGDPDYDANLLKHAIMFGGSAVPGFLRGLLRKAATEFPNESVVEVIPPRNIAVKTFFRIFGVRMDTDIYIAQDDMQEVMARPLDFNKHKGVDEVTSSIFGGRGLSHRVSEWVSQVVPVPAGDLYNKLKVINKAIQGQNVRDQAEEISNIINEDVAGQTEVLITPMLLRSYITRSLIFGLFPGAEVSVEDAIDIAAKIDKGVAGITPHIFGTVFKDGNINKTLIKKGVIQLERDFEEIYEMLGGKKGDGAPNFLDIAAGYLGDEQGNPYNDDTYRQAAANLTLEAATGSTNYAILNLVKRMTEDPNVFAYVKESLWMDDSKESRKRIYSILRAATLDNPPVDLTFREVSLRDQQFKGKTLKEGGMLILHLGNAVRKNVLLLKEEVGDPEMSFLDFAKLIHNENDKYQFPENFDYILGYPWNRFSTNDREYDRRCWGEAFFLAIGHSILKGLINEDAQTIETVGEMFLQSFGPTTGYQFDTRITYITEQ